jgi:hypothetical protein
MAEFFPIDVSNIGSYSGSFSGSFFGDGSGLTGISSDTGSFLVTASFAANSSNTNLSFSKGDGDKFNVNLSKLVDGGTF